MPEDSEDIEFYAIGTWPLAVFSGALGLLFAVMGAPDLMTLGLTSKVMVCAFFTSMFIALGILGIVEMKNSDLPGLVFGPDALVYRRRPWRKMICVKYVDILSSTIIRRNERGWKYYAQISTFDGRNITFNGDQFNECSNEIIVNCINEKLGREPPTPAAERWRTTI